MSRVEPIHAESSSEKLYANTVTVEPVHKGDNSTATRLSVNFGNRSSFMNPDKEIDAAIESGSFRINDENGKLIVEAFSGADTLYTIDITALRGENTSWVYEVVSTGNFLRELVVVGHESGYVPEYEFVTNDMLRPDGTARCDDIYESHYGSEAAQCSREKDHHGQHQSFESIGSYSWSRGGGGVSSSKYGVVTRCDWCGYVGIENEQPNGICKTCEYWSAMLASAKGGIVISGVRYSRGNGFGGKVFTINRFDGTSFDTQLVHNGAVPPFLRDKMPDNAAFADTNLHFPSVVFT